MSSKQRHTKYHETKGINKIFRAFTHVERAEAVQTDHKTAAGRSWKQSQKTSACITKGNGFRKFAGKQHDSESFEYYPTHYIDLQQERWKLLRNLSSSHIWSTVSLKNNDFFPLLLFISKLSAIHWQILIWNH